MLIVRFTEPRLSQKSETNYNTYTNHNCGYICFISHKCNEDRTAAYCQEETGADLEFAAAHLEN